MNARLERKLRLLSGIVAAGIIAGIAFSAAMDRSLIVGIAYGLLISLMLGGIELFVMEGPMLVWLCGLSFTTNLIIQSAIYAANYHILQWFQVGEACRAAPRNVE
jgi:adenylate cyclase